MIIMERRKQEEIAVYIFLGAFFGMFIWSIIGRAVTLFTVFLVAYWVISKKSPVFGLVAGFATGMIIGTFANAAF